MSQSDRKLIFLCKLTLSLIFSAVFASTSLAFGTKANEIEDIQNLNPLTISAVEFKPSDKDINPGQTIEVKLKLKLDPGFHAYLEQYRFQLRDPEGFYLSEFFVTPTVKFTDPITKKTKVGTEGYTEMVSLLETPQGFSGSSHNVKFSLTYQACGADFCLFPKTIDFERRIFFAASAGQNRLSEALDKGWIYALAIVFFAGVLTSLTPCIFPMIPITLAVLGTKDHGHSRRQGFKLSLSYVFGIAMTYAILGVVAAKTGALFGSLLGHPVVVSLIALLFVIMGRSMYGFFEIQAPAALTNRLANTKTQKGIIGAFLSGLIAGVVASPCVGPVLISILAYVAQTQNMVTGFVLLFVYALGLGQLFLVIGTFHTFLQRLPRSGVWMENVKYVFGTMMIGMALYFVQPVAHSALFDGLLATTFFGLSLLTQFYKRHPGPMGPREKLKKSLGVILVILGLIFTMKAFIPEHMRPKVLGQTTTQNYAKPKWSKYSDELLAQATKEKRPVIIDFKADWCLACKELELYTFSDPQVMSLGEKFLWLEFDATSPSDELDALQKRYGIGGLPYILFYDDTGKLRTDLTLTGFEKAPEFLSRMNSALSR